MTLQYTVIHFPALLRPALSGQCWLSRNTEQTFGILKLQYCHSNSQQLVFSELQLLSTHLFLCLLYLKCKNVLSSSLRVVQDSKNEENILQVHQ